MTVSPLAIVRQLLVDVPEELVDELVTEFQELRYRFLLRDWGPSEMNGGRFAEAVLRVLEWMMDGRYTPLGKLLDRQSIMRRVENDPSLPDGHRFHVRRSADILLDMRNKRDVAHLGADVDVNRMDSEFVLRLCSWVLAEMVREFGQADPDTAQQLIDTVSAEQVPWIEDIDGDTLILAMGLSASDRTLLALHHAHPNAVPIPELRSSVGYGNASRFTKQVLTRLARDRRIHIKNNSATITSNGIREIESAMIQLRSE